jgi:DNA-binding NarL/FixJ family response regulator
MAGEGHGTPAAATIGIVVVDDHPVVREGLVAVLEDEPGFAIHGSAGSAAAAAHLVQQQRPDVVLLDLELPDMGGVEAIPMLSAAHPAARILVFTAYDSDERVLGALEAGAAGYLLKGASADEITGAIRAVHAGESVLAPRLTARLVAGARRPGGRSGASPSGADRVTDRERQVLRLVAEGLPNKQIARALGIAERTVKFHVASASRKLGAENRAQAAAVAIRRGLL